VFKEGELKMEYHITMERTQRIVFSFTANNDSEAEEKANELCNSAAPSDFAGGDEERDYALCKSGGILVKDWS
jgi:hypothetical protein